MVYYEDVTAVIDTIITKLDELNLFKIVQKGYTTEIGEIRNIPAAMVFLSRETLRSSSGARAESRDMFVEIWTINRTDHDTALKYAGTIIDVIDLDKTINGTVQWATLSNVECFISPQVGYNLNWSKITYKFERRRLR